MTICKYCEKPYNHNDRWSFKHNNTCQPCFVKKDRIKWLRKKLRDRRKLHDFYIYLHYDSNNKCIYVGKTRNIDTRYDSHKKTAKHFESVKRIYYARVSNETEMHIYEIYYINKYFPKYNITYKNKDDLSFMDCIKELDFKEYV